MKVFVVNPHTIVVDERGNKTPPSQMTVAVRQLANQHFWGVGSGTIKGQGGHRLSASMTKVFHMHLLGENLWVCSTRAMNPGQTAAAAKVYLDTLPKDS